MWVKDRKCFKTINSKDVIFNKCEFRCLSSTDPNAGNSVSFTNSLGTQRSHTQVKPQSTDHSQAVENGGAIL